MALAATRHELIRVHIHYSTTRWHNIACCGCTNNFLQKLQSRFQLSYAAGMLQVSYIDTEHLNMSGWSVMLKTSLQHVVSLQIFVCNTEISWAWGHVT